MGRLASQFVLHLGRIAVGAAAMLPLLVHGSETRADELPLALKRAAGYLAAEVPRWHQENRCYSCHNNGDAVRALAAAARAGLLPNSEPLHDTLRFLQSPESWDADGPDGPFKDTTLAHIQFAAALAAATESRLVSGRVPLLAAATHLAKLQRADGSWPSDVSSTVGSPVTYGEPLAAAIALHTLQIADPSAFARHIEKGQAWFIAREPRNLLDAAATLLAFRGLKSVESELRRAQSLKLIRDGQSSDGGWGPFVDAPAEVFDTAIVLIALNNAPVQGKHASEIPTSIEHGRTYLLSRQNSDGSWPATTRPPGVDSYAQQVSTSGWALQALLATRAENREDPATIGSAECK